MVSQIMKTIIIKGSPVEIFPMWENFESFPLFMKHIISVRKSDDQSSHWMMGLGFKTWLKWDARLTDLQENRRIAWSTISGDVKTSGQVTFRGLDQNETQVTVHMQYVPPLGRFGELIIRWLVDPERKIEEDLKMFKRHAETIGNFSKR